MRDIIISKFIDTVFDVVIRFLVYVLGVISPIKVSPKEISGSKVSNGFTEVSDVRIENRLNINIYDVFVAGISKTALDVKIISDDGPKGKTVEHMDLNTNHLVVHATDKRNGNYLWIFRVHKFSPREVLNLKVKLKNDKPVYFKVLKHSQIENPIKENDSGVVQIPFLIAKIPEI